MNSTVLLAFALLIVTGNLSAQSPEQVFERGNQLYQSGKFAEARDAYESILSNGYVSEEVYFNVGNTYYKLGNIAKAIVNYERACRMAPNDEDLRHNLQLANLLLTDRIEPTPRLFVWDLWDGVKETFSLRSITWITYLAYAATLSALSLLFLARTYKLRKVGLLSGAAAGILFVFCIVIFAGKLSDLGAADTAIVAAGITTIKNSPDPKSSDAFVLHSGVKVQITDRVSDWVKIRLADGKVGWMEKGAAEVI